MVTFGERARVRGGRVSFWRQEQFREASNNNNNQNHNNNHNNNNQNNTTTTSSSTISASSTAAAATILLLARKTLQKSRIPLQKIEESPPTPPANPAGHQPPRGSGSLPLCDHRPWGQLGVHSPGDRRTV